MKAYEKKLAAKLLRLAADEFSNHGCNDLKYEDYDLTQDQVDELEARIAAWTKDPGYEARVGVRYGYDWLVMEFMADLLEPTDETELT